MPGLFFESFPARLLVDTSTMKVVRGDESHRQSNQFNTLGLGRNMPINTGNESEGLLVLKDGQWVILRVPYPPKFRCCHAYRAHQFEGLFTNPDGA